MRELEDVIKTLMYEGYTAARITKEKGEEFERLYQISEDHLLSVAASIINNEEKKMPLEMKKEISVRRALLKQKREHERQERIVNMVKEFVDAIENPVSQRKALSEAIKKVSKLEHVGTDTIKDYITRIDKGFLVEHSVGFKGNTDYLVGLAENIIKNNIPATLAKKTEGYSAMMEYIEANRPDLYAGIKEIYARNLAITKETFNTITDIDPEQPLKAKFNIKNKPLLVEVILEFRVPMSKICEFVNDNKDMFLTSSEPITEDELRMGILYSLSTFHEYGLRLYLFEEAPSDSFIDYKMERFNNFVTQLKSIWGGEEAINFIKKATSTQIQSFCQKYRTRDSVITEDEYRDFAKWCYKYNVSDSYIAEMVNSDGLYKGRIADRLRRSSDIRDAMIANGLDNANNLNWNPNLSSDTRKY